MGTWRFFIKRKNIIINIGLSAASVFATLIIFEVVLRIFYPTILHNQNLRVYDPDVGYKFPPNISVDLDVGNGPHRIITNEYGFIGKSYPINKPLAEWRVANFGDSYAEGVQEVNWDENFVSLLEKYLQENKSRKEINFRSLNFGVPGRGTLAEFWTYEKYGIPAKPDLVVVWFTVGNDFSNNLFPFRKENITKNKMGRVKYILKKSAFVNLLFEYLKDNFQFIKILNYFHLSSEIADTETQIGDGVSREYKINYSLDPAMKTVQEDAYRSTKEIFAEFKSRAEGNQSKFLVVIIPDHISIYSEAVKEKFFQKYPLAKAGDYDFFKAGAELRKILDKIPLEYLDLTEYFEKYRDGNLEIEECGDIFGNHFTPCGHRVTAKIVSQYILNKYFK